MAQDDSVRQ
jgi:hypothetical protein